MMILDIFHSKRWLILVLLCLVFFSGWYRFERYVDYALDVPMYFAYRNKKYVDCTGMTFRVKILSLVLSNNNKLKTMGSS